MKLTFISQIKYICSMQSENLDNAGIVLCKVRIPTLADRVRSLTLRYSILEVSVRKVGIGTMLEYLSIVTLICM